MIQEELRIFIEQNCSGKEPSDLIMEAIGKKIEQYGADADEVLAFVEECVKGPTLEQKEEEERRKVHERQAFIEQMEKHLVEVKTGNLTLYNRNKAELEACIRKAKTIYASDPQIHEYILVLEKEMAKVDEKIKYEKRKKLLTLFSILLVVSVFCGGGYFIYTNNKKKAEAEAFEKSPIHLIDIQCDSLCNLIETLEEPTPDNYVVQKDKYLKINWETINANWSDKNVLHYESNKRDKFYDCARLYAQKLVKVYHKVHKIKKPHKAYEPGFNDFQEYDGLYGYYEYGHRY